MKPYQIGQCVLAGGCILLGIISFIVTWRLDGLFTCIIFAGFFVLILNPSFQTMMWHLFLIGIVRSWVIQTLEEAQKNGQPLPTADHLKRQVNSFLKLFGDINLASSDAMIDNLLADFLKRRKIDGRKR